MNNNMSLQQYNNYFINRRNKYRTYIGTNNMHKNIKHREQNQRLVDALALALGLTVACSAAALEHPLQPAERSEISKAMVWRALFVVGC